MAWNYRVVRRVFKSKRGEDEVTHFIHEAYYSHDGKQISITKDPVVVSGDDLGWVLDRMQRALSRPVIDYDTLEEVKEGEE